MCKLPDKPVILYGAAPQNLRTAYEIIEPAGYHIVFICDKDPNKQGKKPYGIPVISPDELRVYDQATEGYDLVITVRSEATVGEIRNELSDLVHSSIYTIEEFNYHEKINYKISRLSQVVVHITDHCNLNCVRCSHFSPLTKESYFLSQNSFEDDMRQLSKLLHADLPEIQMGGGEPLLHPNCSDFFGIARKYFPNARLLLLTNGSLLNKMGEDFFEECRKADVLINITIYNAGIDYEKIKNLLEEKQIAYSFGDEADWLNLQAKKMEKCAELCLQGGIDGEKSFLECYLGKLSVLRNGRMYFCCIAAYVDLFNQYFGTRLPELKENSVNIYEMDSEEELIRHLMRKMPLCNYCKPSKGNTGIPWARSKREITEWVDPTSLTEEDLKKYGGKFHGQS